MRAFRARPVLLTSLGYFGHMWELYAMWAWFSVFFGSVLLVSEAGGAGAMASLATFFVIGIGAIGCWVGGRLAERVGSARTAIISMVISPRPAPPSSAGSQTAPSGSCSCSGSSGAPG